MAALKTATTKSQGFQTLIDQPDGITTYIGTAKRGAGTDKPLWQIKRLLQQGAVMSIQYANGSDAYNQVWDIRGDLAYS